MRFNHAGLTAIGLTILRLTRGTRRLTPDYTRLNPALMLLRKIYHAPSGHRHSAQMAHLAAHLRRSAQGQPLKILMRLVVI